MGSVVCGYKILCDSEPGTDRMKSTALQTGLGKSMAQQSRGSRKGGTTQHSHPAASPGPRSLWGPFLWLSVMTTGGPRGSLPGSQADPAAVLGIITACPTPRGETWVDSLLYSLANLMRKWISSVARLQCSGTMAPAGRPSGQGTRNARWKL